LIAQVSKVTRPQARTAAHRYNQDALPRGAA
jgi:hypothetical protein